MENVQHNQRANLQLIKAAADGDAEALREIVERHQAMVYRTCLRILRNEADAEDATQATFIVFHQKCRNLKPGTVLGGWLYRTAELVCREFIRSSARRQRREEETGAMNEAAARENVEIWNVLQPELDAALMTLPPKYRDAVVLRYLEGKTTNETAAVMGMSAAAVTTRLARALEQLRAWFQRRGIALSTGVLSVVLAEHATAASVPAALGPSILSAAGHGAMAATASANTSLMAQGALAKMSSLAWHLFNACMFIAWLASMITWVGRGCPIPRWVHILAVCLFAAGLGTVVIMGVMGILTFKFAAACILIPPAAAYAGWLWMFGPDHAKK